MIFETQDEVHTTRDFAFGRFTDFTRYEATASAYGGEIRRVDGFIEVSQGVSWRGTIPIRGKTVGIEATVTEYDSPTHACMVTLAGGMTVTVDMDFEEIDTEKTLVKARCELKANTLAARLIIQSIRLARGTLQKRIDSKLVALGSSYENEYRKTRGTS